jgi:hypothetical protein
MYVFAPCGSQKKQQLFPYILTYWYFLTKTECIYCAVRNQSLRMKRSVAGLSTWRSGFDPRSVHVRFVVEESGNKTGISPTTSVFPCQYHSTNTTCASSYTCFSYRKDKRAMPGNLPRSNYLSEIGGHWIEKSFQFFASL